MTEPERSEVTDPALEKYQGRYGETLGGLLHRIAVAERLNEFGRAGVEGRFQRTQQIEKDKQTLFDRLITFLSSEEASPEDKRGAATLVAEHITNTPCNIDLGMR